MRHRLRCKITVCCFTPSTRRRLLGIDNLKSSASCTTELCTWFCKIFLFVWLFFDTSFYRWTSHYSWIAMVSTPKISRNRLAKPACSVDLEALWFNYLSVVCCFCDHKKKMQEAKLVFVANRQNLRGIFMKKKKKELLSVNFLLCSQLDLARIQYTAASGSGKAAAWHDLHRKPWTVAKLIAPCECVWHSHFENFLSGLKVRRALHIQMGRTVGIRPKRSDLWMLVMVFPLLVLTGGVLLGGESGL